MRASSSSASDKEKKKKKRQSDLELFVFQLMQKSMKEALDAAIDEVLQDWK